MKFQIKYKEKPTTCWASIVIRKFPNQMSKAVQAAT